MVYFMQSSTEANAMPRFSRIAYPEPEVDDQLVEAVQAMSFTLHGWEDLDPLIDRVGGARIVLLGEASHGTAEYYDWRRLISQRLIREKDFSFIAVEGDWPDCYRINRYVKGYADAGGTAREVLAAFECWPTWMWANEEIVRFVEWLCEYNRDLAQQRQVGFYGLDVYSLWESMDAVAAYLEDADSAAAAAARRAFACFEPFGHDVEQYVRSMLWVPKSCEDDVVRMLGELRRQTPRYEHDGREAFFNAEQNAIVVKNAETYYRTMIGGDAASWNIRDRHMVETLNRLLEHHGRTAKAILWEHNTHIGDARYTDMAAAGMVNVGQLVREQHEAEGVVLVGFSSHRGSVIAGDQWGAPMHVRPVPPGRSGSWEDVLHQAGGDQLLLFDAPSAPPELMEVRGHRAIGVVYRPQDEAHGNYVPTVLPRRYDALAFIDETRVLHALGVPASIEHEVPETYPSGV
jgi:erythromycin esterase-like protein